MPVDRRNETRALGLRVLAAAAIAVASTTVAAGPAAAQGIFEFLFGGRRAPAPQTLPPQSTPYADPSAPSSAPDQGPPGSGRSVAYCVRLCDGRFFPIQRHNAATPVQMCSALCPASRTKVFSGSEINHAVANDGSRYADLDNAFVYRERVVSNCTCNGRDAFGLAPVDANADPTLRPGDIVATPTGYVTYTGPRPQRRGATPTGEFTPVRNPPGLPPAKVATAAPAN